MKNEAKQMRRRRVLVIANEIVEGPPLEAAIRFRARDGDAPQAVVVAPALNSRLRHWSSDDDAAREDAELRLAACLEQLRLAGVEAEGWVGDADPLQAIADALQFFPADEIVIATPPERRANWLARRVVDRARARYSQQILQVVVDHDRDPRDGRGAPSAKRPVAERFGASLPWTRGPTGAHRRDSRPRAA
jgi:hypothetical protein